jgi:hypothetical protein
LAVMSVPVGDVGDWNSKQIVVCSVYVTIPYITHSTEMEGNIKTYIDVMVKEQNDTTTVVYPPGLSLQIIIMLKVN